MRIIFISLLYGILLFPSELLAQRASKIRYKAEKLTNVKEDSVKYKKLIDKVVFKQNQTTVYCDSAYFFSKENIMLAFGKVRIIDDSVRITARKLIYKGNENEALLREQVIYRKGNKTLYTDSLNYNIDSEVARFVSKGKMVDESNTLVSDYGVYYSQSDYAYFFGHVDLLAPDLRLKSDTLEYATTTKIAITKGPTHIIRSDSTVVDADGGTFKTAYDQTIFQNGTIETRNYVITGEEIFIDDAKRFYTAKGDVVMTAKMDDIILFGDEAIYDAEEGISTLYGEPLMKRILKEDTLFMSADTLVSIENADKDKERILAFENILIFKEDLQGKCDSAAYFMADSMMHMYIDPVIWNRANQMLADSIDLLFSHEILNKMFLTSRSFLASKDSVGQYNQIKGRSMIGYFDEKGDMDKMDVNGNGESHYYVLKEDSTKSLVGMNKIFCSTMTLRFENNEMKNISFYNNPEAKFIPPHELTEDLLILEGFDWRIEDRPELFEVAKYYATEEELAIAKEKRLQRQANTLKRIQVE